MADFPHHSLIDMRFGSPMLPRMIALEIMRMPLFMVTLVGVLVATMTSAFAIGPLEKAEKESESHQPP